jgi:hypothetical protein
MASILEAQRLLFAGTFEHDSLGEHIDAVVFPKPVSAASCFVVASGCKPHAALDFIGCAFLSCFFLFSLLMKDYIATAGIRPKVPLQ